MNNKMKAVLEEGESILIAQKRLEDGIDDFENFEGEEEFLKRLETGEEVIEHELEVVGQDGE